jgi:hypothetical protein
LRYSKTICRGEVAKQVCSGQLTICSLQFAVDIKMTLLFTAGGGGSLKKEWQCYDASFQQTIMVWHGCLPVGRQNITRLWQFTALHYCCITISKAIVIVPHTIISNRQRYILI